MMVMMEMGWMAVMVERYVVDDGDGGEGVGGGDGGEGVDGGDGGEGVDGGDGGEGVGVYRLDHVACLMVQPAVLLTRAVSVYTPGQKDPQKFTL